MDNIIMVLGPVCVGYIMAVLSVFIGAWLVSRFMIGNQGTGMGIFSPPEPKGDAFTVETPEDMALFPDDLQNEAEEHILQKTNKFLERLSAGHSAEDK